MPDLETLKTFLWYLHIIVEIWFFYTKFVGYYRRQRDINRLQRIINADEAFLARLREINRDNNNYVHNPPRNYDLDDELDPPDMNYFQ